MRQFCAAILAGYLLLALGGAASADIVLGGLIQDLNADLDVSTSGTAVTDWANQVIGFGDDVTQLDVGLQPTLNTGVLGGHNTITFAGSQMIGDDVGAFNALMTGNGFTWFAVVKGAAAQAHDTKASMFGTLLNSDPWSGLTAGVHGSDHAPYTMIRPTADQFVSGTTAVNDSFHVVAGRLAAGTANPLAEVFVDTDLAEGFGNVSVLAETDSDAISLGATRTGSPSENFDGDIARILIYDTPLGDADLLQTGQALATTYGLMFDHVEPPDYSDVTFVGTDTTTKDGWRTDSVDKPLDPNGDDVYGSEGWVFYSYNNAGYQNPYDGSGGNTQLDLPAYIASVSDPPAAWGGGEGLANFGVVDDPLNPELDHNAPHVGLTHPAAFTIERATEDPFTLIVMVGNHDGFTPAFEQDITVSVGPNSDMVRHIGGEDDLDALYHLFDIGAGEGDVLVALGNTSIDNPGLIGFAFEVPEPTTVAMLLSLGLMGLVGYVCRGRSRNQT